MSDAMDIKESLGAHHVKATTPPTGATKDERLKEAQAHVAAAAAAGLVPQHVAGRAISGRDVVSRTFKDPQFGHMVEETILPIQAPGLSPAGQPAVTSTGPRGAQPAPVVRQHELAKKDDPGNTSLTGNLDVLHKPVPPSAKK